MESSTSPARSVPHSTTESYALLMTSRERVQCGEPKDGSGSALTEVEPVPRSEGSILFVLFDAITITTSVLIALFTIITAGGGELRMLRREFIYTYDLVRIQIVFNRARLSLH
ncbi:unnamed protein product [Rhizoctonia solani]|uniref:Uncharacterized protein n=1 Tax=Rhizoctonia solani TaxID=456999 RepID=A0A8H3C3V6_9AGAM|nr:unnamed protein product [Rhizoctonia solani]CAE6516948.1 unnamed protein product [Rhizoctonia solani]